MPDDAWTRYAHSIVACARWESAHIVEWLEYHRSVGFDHVYLYCNDDDPQEMLRLSTPYLFGPRPFVTFRHWPVAGQIAEMFLHFLRTFKSQTAWFSFLDADEFFVFKHVNDVKRFMQPFEQHADRVYFNCINYGANGKLVRDDASVLMSHLRRAAEAEPRTKMICRAQSVDAEAVAARWRDGGGPFWEGAEFWEGPDGGGSDGRSLNVLHQPADGGPGARQAGGGPSAEPPVSPELSEAIINTGYIAHFRFKSEADFQRRADRGGLPDSGRWLALRKAGEHRAILDRDNAVYDTYLAGFWHRVIAPALDVSIRVPPEELPAPNIALNKPSWQSSIYEAETREPGGSRVFGAGNNGLRLGVYGFHTKLENSPWWVVDLLGAYGLLAVRLYNRVDSVQVTTRSNEIDVLVSMDAASWTVIHSRTNAAPFGGVRGEPMQVHLDEPAPARFLALRSRKRTFLHLDEIEVYGLPL